MTTKTFIPGKQAALEDSIARMQSILTELEFQMDSNPVLNPVKNIYSQHIFDQRCKGLFTNGKGACEKSCYASALGEFLERLSTNYFFSDYLLEMPSETEDFATSEQWLYYPDEKCFSADNFHQMLSDELWAFYQQDQDEAFGFEDFLSLNDQGNHIRAIPMQSVKTGETVYFPMNLLSNLYASNGLSAGNTAIEAQIQGLSEIFERWVKNRIFRENLCIPEVPQAILEQFPAIMESIAQLEAQGLRVSVRDASLGGVYPVVNVTLIDSNEARCFASFGSHPIFEVALERTLTESLQGRHLQDLDGFQTPVHDAELVGEDENIENHFIDSSGLIHAHFLSHAYDFNYSGWQTSGNMDVQWQQLCELVWAENSDVYVAHYRQFGFEAVRMVVPGMSEVYALSELVENNQNRGRELRNALMQWDLSVSESERLLDVIDEQGFSDHQGVASLIGLMPDRGSFWGQMTIAQLRFWCFYHLQEWENAYEQAQDLQYFLHQDNPWRIWFKGFVFVAQQLDVEELLEDFDLMSTDLSSFEALFPSQIAASIQSTKTESAIAKQPLQADIFCVGTEHQVLLNIYQSLRQAKMSV